MTILPIWLGIESDFFFIWYLKIDWFPVGPFGLTFVKNYWWGIWPSCQIMKKCCWPIWASKSGKMFRPKNDFPKFGFWTVKFFLLKKVTNIQIVTYPYLGRLLKNVLEVFQDDIAVCESHEKWVFFNRPFLDPLATSHTWCGPKSIPNQKNGQRDFCSLVHCPWKPN